MSRLHAGGRRRNPRDACPRQRSARDGAPVLGRIDSMVSYLARCARGAPTEVSIRSRSVRISSNARLVVFWFDFFGGIGVHDSRELPGVLVRQRPWSRWWWIGRIVPPCADSRRAMRSSDVVRSAGFDPEPSPPAVALASRPSLKQTRDGSRILACTTYFERGGR